MSEVDLDLSDDDRNSPPIMPPDSPGSSVSTRLQDEYSELLKYAVVVPTFDAESAGQILEERNRLTETEDKNGGSESRNGEEEKGDTPLISTQVLGRSTDGDRNSNSVNDLFNLGSASQEQVDMESTENWNSNKGETLQSEFTHDWRATMDPAVSDMGEKLDSWLGRLKSDILAQFSSSTMTCLHSQRLSFQEEVADIISQKQRLEREVNRLNELVNTYELTIARKDTLIDNLTQSLATQKDKVKLSRSFFEWRVNHIDQQRESFTEKIARLHHEKAITQKVMKSWFGRVQQHWKSKLERSCQAQAQQVCLRVTNDYEAKISSLNETIRELEQHVVQLQKEKEQYSEQVKKAFMRGVCALNMEAMSAFASDDTNANNDAGQGKMDPSHLSSSPRSAPHGNINNNLESSSLPKEDWPPKSIPALVDLGGGAEVERQTLQPHSLPQTATTKVRGKAGSGSGKNKPTSARSSRPGLMYQGQPLAPPMASVIVERHQPVTKQTVGQATAAQYPKQTVGQATAAQYPKQTGGSSKGSRHPVGSGVISKSQPPSVLVQSFKPLAGQTTSYPPSVKVVD